MTRNEVIKELCDIVGMVYQSMGDFSHASDCFCEDWQGAVHFRHEGKTLEFVKQAVVEKLHRDGFSLPAKFKNLTGVTQKDENDTFCCWDFTTDNVCKCQEQ